MPRIQDYQTTVSAQADIGGRRATVADFGNVVDNGAALSQAADYIGEVVQRQEVSDVSAKMAEKRAEWTVKLQERANESELGDPEFASKFNEDFNNDISGLGDNIHTAAGRRVFKQSQAELTAHFVQSAGMYQAKSAGEKSVLDYSRALDANRNTLIADPSQFKTVLADSTRALDDREGSYAKMPAVDREKLKRQTEETLALSAVQGEIRLDPKAALDRLKDGAWASHLDADKTFTMQRQAEIGIHAKELEAARLEAAARKREGEAQKATENKFIAKLVEDPTSLSAKSVSDSNMLPDDKIKWLGIIDRAAKPGVMKTDPGVYLDLFERAHLPVDDPRAIKDESELDKYFGKGLTMDALKELRAEVSGKRTPEGQVEAELKKGLIDFAKSSLTGSNNVLGWRDPKGDEQLQRYMSYFLPEFAKQRQAGKSAIELLSPDSPDYLGKAIDQYKRPMAQMLKDRIGGLGEVGDPLAIAVPQPKSEAEYNALPKGSNYIGTDGKTKVKQ